MEQFEKRFSEVEQQRDKEKENYAKERKRTLELEEKLNKLTLNNSVSMSTFYN